MSEKNNYKFYRCLSPITASVIFAFDIATVVFFVSAIKKFIEKADGYRIIFVIIMVSCCVIAGLVTKEIMSNGVRFFDEYVEFTGLDDNNKFEYANIERVEGIKDTKVSLRKNFVDRYSNIIIYNNDGSCVTIALGLTTKKTLDRIICEINSHLHA